MSGDAPDMPDASADPVVDALLRASRALVAITSRSLSAVNSDVTLAQFRSLVVLATAGPQTVSALADRLAVHASTMTRMCNRLVARGLVVRAPSAIDRREVVIALTSMGTSVVENVMAARRKELDAVMRRMGDDDRLAVVVALDKFAQAAGVAANPPDTQPPDTQRPDTKRLVTRAARQLLEEP
jgi:DNA-binding MarR family transcriptional regulator